MGGGNIGIHNRSENRYCCHVCHKAFSAPHGTALYRVKHEADVFIKVSTLLACPVQAVGKAFNLDERTVTNWLQRSGAHCQQVHEAIIGTAKLDELVMLRNVGKLTGQVTPVTNSSILPELTTCTMNYDSSDEYG